MEASASKTPLLSEGLLLACATLAGYAVAFAREAGYASYFGVPLDLVSVEITTILVTIAALLGLAWVLFIVFNPLSGMLVSTRLPEPLRDRLRTLAFAAVVTVSFVHLYGIRWPHIGKALTMVAILLFLELGLPLVTQRKVRGYFAKLAAANASPSRPETPSPILYPIFRALGRERLFLLLVFGFAVYMAHSIGRADATKCEWFHCPLGTTDVVLVRTYGSTMVGAKFDPGSRHLVGELVLGPRGEGLWANLKWTKAGPLLPLTPGNGPSTP